MFTKIKLSLSTGSALLVLAAVGMPLSATASAPGVVAHVPTLSASQPSALNLMTRTAPQDVGLTEASKTITSSIILKMSDEKSQELADFIKSTVTPGDPQYHKFLTVAQFRERFAPSSDKIQQFVAYLNSHGLKVTGIDPDGLGIHATGSVAQFDGAFSTQIHDFVKNGQRFHRPAWKPVAPAEFADVLLSVPGLSSESGMFHPKNVRLGQGAYAKILPPRVHLPNNKKHGNGNPVATGVPQQFTVGDVANFYQVNPFYGVKIKGQGRTVGIMTLANFSKADANTYWSDIGLTVKANRITKVAVDGGTPISCDCGNDETSLDVEQSGGLAPKANIVVYIAPNTNQGFIDLFGAAANQNVADTVSVSWGEPEEFYFANLNNGTDETGQMVAVDQYLKQGAAQGQSFFTASGDSGGFDINRSLPSNNGDFTAQLTVDFPASDPNITAAGGTTVGGVTIPGFTGSSGLCSDIYIPQEQVWGWDYLVNAWGTCDNLTDTNVFSVGGGGGVSTYWTLPSYQQVAPGSLIQLTLPFDETLECLTTAGCTEVGAPTTPFVLNTLPSDFPGRNLPDLSLNADPETGYLVYDTLDFGGFATGFGGTSFVAPQLNGITALMDQAVGSRLGLLNPQLYLMQQITGSGLGQPFNYVEAGDNWIFTGWPGYNPGAGIGTINATNLAIEFAILQHTSLTLKSPLLTH